MKLPTTADYNNIALPSDLGVGGHFLTNEHTDMPLDWGDLTHSYIQLSE